MKHSIRKCTRAVFMACMLIMPSVMWAEKEAWVEFSSSTLTFHYDENKSSCSNEKYSLPGEGEIPKWQRLNNIYNVVFDESFADARPKSCYRWFKDKYITNITGIEYLNTSEVTSMESMFMNCAKLTSLDLSHFNTENVTTMKEMFYGCQSLSELNVSSFNTSKVTDMSYMFYWCHVLSTLDFSSFDTRNVTDMTSMFRDCYILNNIRATDLFVTDQVTSYTNMFSDCKNLPNYQDSNVGKTAAKDYLTYTSPQSWVEYQSSTSTLTFHCDNTRTAVTATNKYDLPAAGESPGWLERKKDIVYVVFDKSFANARPERCTGWFNGMVRLLNIEGMEYLNTDSVNDMSNMFLNCLVLTSVDLSHLNTENVTTMTHMFCACRSLKGVDLSSFNTSKVDDMSYMFYCCDNLSILDLSSFNTAKVTHMQNMFEMDGKTKLERIFVSEQFVTDKVDEDKDMFKQCTALSGFDANQVNKEKAHYKEGGYFILRRHFSVGDTQYDVDGYDAPTCYTDVGFTDGSAYSATFDFVFDKGNTASYTREVKNHWATLTLPFAFSADDNTAKFYSVESYTDGNIAVTPLTGTVAAGTPVLAYVTNGELAVCATGAATVHEPVSDPVLNGVFTQTEVADDGYIVANDHFWNAGWLKQKNDAQHVYAAPYRASLTLDLSPSEAKPSTISISGDETDGIDSIDTMADKESLFEGAELYDLQGRRLSAPVRGMMVVRKGGVSRTVVVK